MAASSDIATLAVTALTGTALAVFAYLTYKLNKNITQLRYSPILEVYPIGSPETGSFDYGDFRYRGVMWQVNLINSGNVPLWVDNINISMLVTRPHKPEEDTWTGIGKLCELYDEKGSILGGRALGINGNSQHKITILMCYEDRTPEEHRMFKAGDTTVMRIELLQRGVRGKPTGWLIERSYRFQLPKEFGKEPIVHVIL
jgi:hypothetical protein